MNKATFYNRLSKAGLTKVNGEIKSGYDWVVCALAEGRRIRGSYSGRGRHTSYVATDYNRACEIVKALGLEGEFGNDAARGGKIGDYVALTKKDLAKIDFLVKELKEAADCHEIAHQLLHILNNDGVKKAIREIAAEF